MSHSFFKKNQTSNSDKEKIETLLKLLEKTSNFIKKSPCPKGEIKETLEIACRTAMDLSLDTLYLTKEDLLKDLHLLKTMVDNHSLHAFGNYLDSVIRLLRALVS
jgi:hypothetical protein